MSYPQLFEQLEEIHSKPILYSKYTSDVLWTDLHSSKKMLEFHLDPEQELASRKANFIDASVKWILDYFQLQPGDKVCDFGCGPGLYTQRLAREALDVTGLDFSERSIDYAKQKAQEEQLCIRYLTQDYLSFTSSERYQLITMIYCDFSALSDEGRLKILRSFAELLDDEGAVLLDVHHERAFESIREQSGLSLSSEPGPMQSFWSPHPYYVFQQTFRYEDDKVALSKFTIVEAERTREVFNWLKYFGMSELNSLFQECGLEITEVFGDVSGKPPGTTDEVMAVVARKRRR